MLIDVYREIDILILGLSYMYILFLCVIMIEFCCILVFIVKCSCFWG